MRHHKGYITLLSVLVVGAVGIAITVSLVTLGVGASRSSFAYQQLHQAKALANACAEEALQQIRSLDTFTGANNLTLGVETCSYSVTSQGGQNRTINATGTVGTIVRKVQVSLTAINPNLIVSSWHEVP